MSANPYRDTEKRLIGDIYTSTDVMDNLTVLCDDFGSRFAGLPENRQAADFIAATLSRYGLEDAQLEPFEYAGWTRGEAVVEVIEPIPKALTCISLPYCPAGDLTAELISVGQGTPADYDRLSDDIAGKIVLADSGSPTDLGRWVHRQEKYGRAVLAGAVGFVFVSHHVGYGVETGSLQDDKAAPIPGISLAREDALFLERVSERRGSVRLHLRTTDINQGAVDPASGVAVVLEAARVLARHAGSDLQRTVRFIGYGCEEIGLTGSYRYVDRHDAELDAIRFVLNLDSAGGGGRKGIILHRWPALEPFFRQASREMAYPFPVGQQVNSFSDHFPFFLQGVASGGMGDPEPAPTGRGFGHTRYDTLDKVEIANLRDASGVAARLALRIANADDFPSRRRDDDQVQEIVGRIRSGRVPRRPTARRAASAVLTYVSPDIDPGTDSRPRPQLLP